MSGFSNFIIVSSYGTTGSMVGTVYSHGKVTILVTIFLI